MLRPRFLPQLNSATQLAEVHSPLEYPLCHPADHPDRRTLRENPQGILAMIPVLDRRLPLLFGPQHGEIVPCIKVLPFKMRRCSETVE